MDFGHDQKVDRENRAQTIVTTVLFLESICRPTTDCSRLRASRRSAPATRAFMAQVGQRNLTDPEFGFLRWRTIS